LVIRVLLLDGMLLPGAGDGSRALPGATAPLQTHEEHRAQNGERDRRSSHCLLPHVGYSMLFAHFLPYVTEK
jgi:hypothetical protein